MSLETNHLEILNVPLPNALFIVSLKKDITQCFQVNAKYKGAKDYKGIRAAVYKCAHKYQACYSLDRSKSIWYDDGSADLNIALWFEEKSKAKNFHYFLETWHQMNPVVKGGDVTVEDKIEEMLIEDKEFSSVRLSHCDVDDSVQSLEFSSVWLSHYDVGDSVQSLEACKSSVTSAISNSTPLAQLQSIEDMSAFQALKPYICHIKPKGKFDHLKNDPNNKLAASWLFHQMFDGLNTVDGISGRPNIPVVAVVPVPSELKEEMVGEPSVKRKRVEIELEYRDSALAKCISLKDGSTKLSDTRWRTFVHVEDANKFSKYLEWKNEDTRKQWNEVDQFDEYMLNRD
jgi:hypothetical protein